MHSHRRNQGYFTSKSSMMGAVVFPRRSRTIFLKAPSMNATTELYAKRFPKCSKVSRTNFSVAEEGWNSRFSVNFSKDNNYHHRQLREYFDMKKRDIELPFITDRKHGMKGMLEKVSPPVTPRHKLRMSRKWMQREESWVSVFNPISELNLEKPSRLRKLFAS